MSSGILENLERRLARVEGLLFFLTEISLSVPALIPMDEEKRRRGPHDVQLCSMESCSDPAEWHSPQTDPVVYLCKHHGPAY